MTKTSTTAGTIARSSGADSNPSARTSDIPETIRELVKGFGANRPGLEALHMAGRGITYGELETRVIQIGNALLNMGIGRGDRIGILAENRLEWPIAYLAVTSIGATAVTLDIFLTDREIATVLETCTPRMVFTSNKYLSKITAAQEKLSSLRQVVCFDDNEPGPGRFSFESIAAQGQRQLAEGTDRFGDVEVDPESIAQIIFLSTTLGVELSHRCLMANLEGIVPLMGGRECYEKQWLDILPFHHSWPTTVGLLVPLVTSSTITILATSKMDQVLTVIKEREIDNLMLVPALVERLYQSIYVQAKEDGLFDGLDLPPSASPAQSFDIALAQPGRRDTLNATLDRLGLGRMTSIWSAGAHLYLGAVAEMKALGLNILDSYGLTETGPIISHGTDRCFKMGAAGRVIHTAEVEIDKPDKYGNGEILARGPVLMSGYFGNPQATAAAFDEDGWLHTGDLGALDDDGYLFITGRCKNIIVNSGGKNIYPEEIEAAIRNSPLIADVVVTPKIVGRRELPFAIVQPDIEAIWFHEREKKHRLSDEDIRSLIQREIQTTTAEIAHYKLPEDFEITFDDLDTESYRSRRLFFEDPVSGDPTAKEKHRRGAGDRAREQEPGSGRIGMEALAGAVATFLCQRIAGALKIDPTTVNAETSFFEYLSSLDIIDVAAVIEGDLKIKLYPPMLFEHINIVSLAGYFATEFREEFIALLGEEQIKAAAAGWVGKPAQQHDVQASAQRPASAARTIPKRKRPPGNEPIAIVGVAALLPGARDLDEFWDHLAAGDDLISEIPKDRFDWEEYFGDPLAESNKMNTKWGGFIADVDKFDPSFFGISPKEARLMDPQHRKFLETVWKAIEDSGHKPSSLLGANVGLFAGITAYDYAEILRANSPEVGVYTYTSVSPSVLPNRVSYILGIHGPSETVDTACSSALVAIHRARRAIENGECDMAIAGGVNFLLTPELFLSFSKAGMLSPDGRCKTFSSDANGYVRGEGVGAVVLKPLARALADRDHIYAIIKGGAVNHGGRASSMTAPNPNAQAALLVAAYEDAECDPDSVSYIEAHGTGTSLGDPIEINGLKKAFKEMYERAGKAPSKRNFCGLGSVKTNIGHLEGAAGIAGLLKILLAMKHRTLPATLHLREVSPYVDIEDSPFYLTRDRQPWESPTGEGGEAIPRRAGVSSFGVGGANAHIVLEEYNAPEARREADLGEHIVVLSAKKEDRLVAYAREVADYLARERGVGLRLGDIAFTLQNGRDEMAERLAVVTSSADDLRAKLAAFAETGSEIAGLLRGSLAKKDKAAPPDPGITPQAVADAMGAGDNLAIARLWTMGATIDWAGLQKNQAARRISLPTYPFAQKRYWVKSLDE